ncbi:hypothetical protein N0V93_002573 [Gnomoniopsis smithogilvyi]|uniref:N-acetyltransferase domain-containing protein n=1 Tax=Gnomoniopsis smithogilvyi TaxID=1191159 RepID=A0A9W8YZ41_9PEZI|nr:hypothetical protein N0V93_002573 [Gnomoniopsis smithogilvyi]
MSSPLHLRDARKDEMYSLIALAGRAFKGRAFSDALFPPHLQTYPNEELDFRAERQLRRFDKEDLHYLVVADEADTPVGWAIWQSPSISETKPGEPEGAGAALRAALPKDLPKGLDLAVLAELEKGTEVLDKTLQDALGQDGYKQAWYLDAIAVDPDHQRRGIAKMLMQWGHERADAEHRNVRLMSSEKGSNLYRAVGYEEVGSVECCGAMEYAFIRKAA